MPVFNLKVRSDGFKWFVAAIFAQGKDWPPERKSAVAIKWREFVAAGNDVIDVFFEDGCCCVVCSPAFERFLREQGFDLPSDTNTAADGRDGPPR